MEKRFLTKNGVLTECSTVTELREQFNEVLSHVFVKKTRVGVIRHGVIYAVLIPIEELEVLEEALAARAPAAEEKKE